MQIKLKERHPISVPSASGIEMFKDRYYVIGDDSQFLFILNSDRSLLRKVKLFEPEEIEKGRIPKKLKADLEAISVISIDRKDYLLVIGSGSKPAREKAFVINLNDPDDVMAYSLSSLYEVFRSDNSITGGEKLNIEGLASDDSKLFLFQRGNIGGKNVMIEIATEDFLKVINGGKIPDYKLVQFNLPSIQGIPSGFSGATYMADSGLLIYTASVEDTENEIDDGKVMGSLVGIIDMGKDKSAKNVFLKQNGGFLPVKIESLTIHSKNRENEFILATVTDNDQGGSELILLDLYL